MQLATRRAFTIVPNGPFSLREAATFAFGHHVETAWDGVMRLAFCADGYADQAGVEVRQDERGVHCVVFGDASVDAVRAQVARILSLDRDGEAFARIGERDPVMARLLTAAPGLRPPLFYSPYEAAAWAVLSVRRVPKQMASVRRRLCEAHGATFQLAGERVAAFPTPDQLLVVDAFPGISADRLARMHGVARAALDGLLDIARIHALGPEAAMADLQRIGGIGPFYSALIVVRASGFADVLPLEEQKALALAGELYGLGAPATREQFTEIAEAWRPFRTWAVVLMRAAASRLTAPRSGSSDAAAA
ncbi:MAG: 3-methyladenine glycosylase/8-oxoguanine glycosylase-like protein [Candidatus Eremiobacteraeota bacterium]|nr:3-methyladenine glycosylase/8-oxoguanine glycosylase-like protein [Candidatus Eremiobacteraeota bacterium]